VRRVITISVDVRVRLHAVSCFNHESLKRVFAKFRFQLKTTYTGAADMEAGGRVARYLS